MIISAKNNYKDIKEVVEAMQKAVQGWVPVTEDICPVPDSENILVHGVEYEPLASVEFKGDVIRMYPYELVVLNKKELCYLITGAV